MKKILFAGFTEADVGTIMPVADVLRGRASVAFLAGLMEPAAVSNHESFALPKRAHSAESLTKRERSIVAATRDAECLALSDQWVSRYPAFVESTLVLWAPDLVVLTPNDVEPSIVARAARKLGVPYVCVLPQFYEFKYDALLEPYADALAYVVAGRLGHDRLLTLGVPERRIRRLGNPKFDALLTQPQREPGHRSTATVPSLLYVSQALPENHVLWRRLLRYLRGRPAVRLELRVHPGARGGRGEDARPFLESVSGDLRTRVTVGYGELVPQLERATAFVTIHSNAVFDAWAASCPVVLWSPECLPSRVPFASLGGARVARNFAELELHLDNALGDTEDRSNCISAGHASIEALIGHTSSTAAVADFLLASASLDAVIGRKT